MTVGIILAGGSGTRLRPLTQSFSKQLLPVYDKPMIYYPLATLMLAGIREFALISTPHDQVLFKNLLGDGSQLGIDISYFIQSAPKGIAESFLICENFIGERSCALILGDNIFYGQNLGGKLAEFVDPEGAVIFGYRVSNPSDYGVLTLGDSGKPIAIREKPENPDSNIAIPGLYFFDNNVVEVARQVKPSTRGELEITSVLNSYLEKEKLTAHILPRGTAWLDTGSFETLHDASSFIKAIEDRQGLKISCVEEISFRSRWIDKTQLKNLAESLSNSEYGEYLNTIFQESD
jgi:glucose-1-phosphate thymidylyltransferase